MALPSKKKKKTRSRGKKEQQFLLCCSTTLALFLPLSRTTVSYLKSSAAWETIPVEGNKVNSCQLRVTHESKTAFGLFMTARTRELQPSSALPPSLNPFAHGIASMLIVCCHSRREVNTRVNMLAFKKSQSFVFSADGNRSTQSHYQVNHPPPPSHDLSLSLPLLAHALHFQLRNYNAHCLAWDTLGKRDTVNMLLPPATDLPFPLPLPFCLICLVLFFVAPLCLLRVRNLFLL